MYVTYAYCLLQARLVTYTHWLTNPGLGSELAVLPACVSLDTDNRSKETFESYAWIVVGKGWMSGNTLYKILHTQSLSMDQNFIRHIFIIYMSDIVCPFFANCAVFLPIRCCCSSSSNATSTLGWLVKHWAETMQSCKEFISDVHLPVWNNRLPLVYQN